MKIQPNSLRIWLIESSGLYYASAKIQLGRLTQTVNGPEALDEEGAVRNLRQVINYIEKDDPRSRRSKKPKRAGS